jgi:tetratricopeptide (TPR) repeat protein
MKLARWPKSDGMIRAPATAARNTRSAAWPLTRLAARAAGSAPPTAVPARRPSLASHVREHDELDELTEASNAVVDMVQAGNLDAAEQAAHELLARFPDVHDGYDRLGMVCEARGNHRQAADYYRRAINVIRNRPDNYDPEFEGVFQTLIDRLEPTESVGLCPQKPRG